MTCAGIRANGQPCKSPVLLADGFCRLHSPTLRVDATENARRAGQRSGEVRRDRRKSLQELVAERLEAAADEVYRELRSAIERCDREAAYAVVDRAMGMSREDAVALDGRRELLDRTRTSQSAQRWSYV